MISTDIDTLVSQSIDQASVFRRLVEMVSRPASFSCCEMTDDEVTTYVALHKRRASYSTCHCPYCGPIKAYVAAKLFYRRLARDDYDLGVNGYRRMEDALIRLQRATVVKEAAQRLDLAAILGLTSDADCDLLHRLPAFNAQPLPLISDRLSCVSF